MEAIGRVLRGRIRSAGLLATATIVLVCSSAPSAPAKAVTKPPDVTTTNQTFEVSGDRFFVDVTVECPNGFYPTGVVSDEARPVGGTIPAPFEPASAVVGLKAVSEYKITDGGIKMQYSAAPGALFEVRVTIRCVKRKVTGKAGGEKFSATTSKPTAVQQGVPLEPGARGEAMVEGGSKRVPVGWVLSPAELLFPTPEYLRAVIFARTALTAVLGNPAPEPQVAFLAALFLKRNAKAKAKGGATAAARPKAKPRVIAASTTHTVSPHASADQSQDLTASCPKKHSVTSFAWDANDGASVDVFLRPFPSYGKRDVTVPATNFGAQPHEVTLTAICLAVRVKA